MGFSVTASFVIFGVALLGALSGASSAYWKTQSGIEAAQRVAHEHAVKEAHANLTLWSVAWDAGAGRETFKLTNSGTVGLDDSQFQYLFDGVVTFQAQSAGYPLLEGASPGGSVLLLPGETLDCGFDLASEPGAIMVITEFGSVYAHAP